MNESDSDNGFGKRELTLAARAMIEMFGNDAADKALARAGDYELKGESEGQRFWIQLAEMIQEMLDQKQGDEPQTT